MPGENVLAILQDGRAHDARRVSTSATTMRRSLTAVAQRFVRRQRHARVPVTEQYLLDLEREAFLSLCGEKKTQERIAFTLKTGKPLRN